MIRLKYCRAATEVGPLSHPTRVYPSWAAQIVEVGYIRLRWERVGVRGYDVHDRPHPLTRSAARTDLSHGRGEGAPAARFDFVFLAGPSRGAMRREASSRTTSPFK